MTAPSSANASPETPRLRAEVRRTATLAAPLIAGHVSAGAISLVDAIIAGHHGTITLAAVSIGTAFYWLCLLVPMGTLIALPALVSQADGAGRRADIAPIFRQSLWLALALGLGIWLLMTLAPLLMARVGIDADIRPGATAFIHGIRWGMPALTVYLCIRYLCDGLHHTLPTMLLSIGGLLLLIPLGYALTFGAAGLPAMGAGGLGVASAVMMWAQLIAAVLYLTRAARFRALGLFDRFEPPRAAPIRELLVTGVPIGLTWLMEGGLFVGASLAMGRLGEVPSAAHQIALNVVSLCFMVPVALAEATTVRVGHALGRGDAGGVRRAALAGVCLVLCSQALSGSVLLSANDAIAGLYTADAAVAALAASLLLWAALFQFPDGIQAVCAGALRGLKDTRVPLLLAALSYWAVGMPLGVMLGLGVGTVVPALGPQGMWMGLSAGLVVAAVLLGLRFRYSARRLPAAGATATTTPAPPSPFAVPSGGMTDGA